MMGDYIMDSMTNYRRLDDIYFSTDAMRNVFSDSNRIQKQMDCEAALAKVEGALGIIPKECAAEIQANPVYNILILMN